MMVKVSLPLLELLADGQFHSGATIGELLGVSRTAVWKQLQKLGPLGLPIESVKGRGYRLHGGLDLLSQSAIVEGLGATAKPLLDTLEVLVQVDSTNALAMQEAASGNARYVCFAEHQSAGRGRRGRAWQSPFGQNLYFSVVWCFEGGAAALEGLSLAVGVCVARVLHRLGLDRVGLKWPNDILVDQRKLGGILLEMTGDPAGRCVVVVGVGLNVLMSAEAVSHHHIDQPWVSLKDALGGEISVSRNQLAASLLSEILPMLDTFMNKGFATYQQDWAQFDAFVDKPVVLQSGNVAYQGVVLGVSPSGALRLDIDGQEREFFGGEVSLRLADHDT